MVTTFLCGSKNFLANHCKLYFDEPSNGGIYDFMSSCNHVSHSWTGVGGGGVWVGGWGNLKMGGGGGDQTHVHIA